jgi:hypothetical protein
VELKEQVRNNPHFLSTVVPGDESWIYGFDPETKQHLSQWKCPFSHWLKKAQQVKSSVKSMLICFFNTDGIIHKEFVSPGQTVNAKFYSNVLKQFKEDMRRKWPHKWHVNNWVLHQDNAPVHIALALQQFLASKIMTVILHPRPHPVTSSCSTR